MNLEWIPVAAAQRWAAALSSIDADFFHQAWYHQIAQRRGEGEAHCVVARDGDRVAVLPLLLRPTPDGTATDATSVYGYAGPVVSAAGAPVGFASALRESLRERGVIALFSRLHPLLSQRALVEGLGEVVAAGTTVSLDLTAPEEAQRGGYRSNYRNEIRRLHRDGYTCRIEGRQSLSEFIDVYEDTMRRVSAAAYYFFPRDDYARMLDEGMQLFVARKAGEVASASLFSCADGIVEYYLSGTALAPRRAAPTTLLSDEARMWATSIGAHTLHLGGGVGGQRDSLFKFKAGFSKRHHPFEVWRWIVDADRYATQCRTAGVPLDTPYFPAYRSQ